MATATEHSPEVAQNILLWMNTNTNKLAAIIGAKNFVYSNNSLQFHFKLYRKANICLIEYIKATDLYRMTFKKYNSRTLELKDINTYEGVYGEDLKRIFESETGLYISL